MPYETTHKGISICLVDREDGAVDVSVSPAFVPAGCTPTTLGSVTIENCLEEELLKVVIKPEHLSMFPTMTSLEACVDMATVQLPINDKNSLLWILYTYHNTLLATIAKKEA